MEQPLEGRGQKQGGREVEGGIKPRLGVLSLTRDMYPSGVTAPCDITNRQFPEMHVLARTL